MRWRDLGDCWSLVTERYIVLAYHRERGVWVSFISRTGTPDIRYFITGDALDPVHIANQLRK